MWQKVLMLLVEMNLGLRSALLPPIIQVIILYHLVFIVIVITEVKKGIASSNFMHGTVVE